MKGHMQYVGNGGTRFSKLIIEFTTKRQGKTYFLRIGFQIFIARKFGRYLGADKTEGLQPPPSPSPGRREG